MHKIRLFVNHSWTVFRTKNQSKIIIEHGTADLYDKTIRKRVEALINVADPEFRDALTVKAKELNYM